jgi:hypothetical protein
MKRRGYVWVLLGFLFGCSPDSVLEPVPAYLYIPSFSLRTTPAQGTASSLVTDIWLTVGGEFLGAYELPALIPVLQTGAVDIRLDAGIRDNGIHATPEIYPFYNPVQLQVSLEPGEVDTLQPITSYITDTRFALMEPFEQPDHLMRDLRVGGQEALRWNEHAPFEGRGSLEIQLSADQPVVELASLTRFRELGKKSPFVYLELNYKSEVPVVFGLVGYARITDTQGSVLLNPGFYPVDDWQKIYFNLSSLVQASGLDAYQVVLRAVLADPSGKPQARVLLDNLKLVYF